MSIRDLMAGRGGEARSFAPVANYYAPSRDAWGGFNAGVPVTSENVIGIPAVADAVRKAAEQVAMLELGAYRGRREFPERVDGGWRARLLAGEPNEQQTPFVFMETVESSLTFRGNAFIWLVRDQVSGQILEWYALHPDQVLVTYSREKGVRYQVAVSEMTVDPLERGPAFYDVGPDVILHVKGHGGGVVAPSPVQQFASALGVGVAKMAHEAKLYRKGTALRQVIVYPEEMDSDQVRVWRELWQQTYEGADGHTTGVLGGGPKLQQVGMTQSDAQFIESQNFSVSEIARMFNVPASLLGGGASGAGADSTPLSPEHERDRWYTFGLSPRLRRIETAVTKAVFAGSSQFAMFSVAGVFRADVATTADIAIRKVQSGIWLPDEARARDGLGELAGGVGKIPQITPVGGTSNEGSTPVVDAPPAASGAGD